MKATKKGMAMGGVAALPMQTPTVKSLPVKPKHGRNPVVPPKPRAMPPKPKAALPKGIKPIRSTLPVETPRAMPSKPKAALPKGIKPSTSTFVDPSRMAKGGAVKKGMTMGGMAKKGKC